MAAIEVAAADLAVQSDFVEVQAIQGFVAPGEGSIEVELEVPAVAVADFGGSSGSLADSVVVVPLKKNRFQSQFNNVANSE